MSCNNKLDITTWGLVIYVVLIVTITYLSYNQGIGDGMKKICKDEKIYYDQSDNYFCAEDNPIEFGGYEFVLPDEYKQMKID